MARDSAGYPIRDDDWRSQEGQEAALIIAA
jgi:hypothetical protein